MLTEVKKMNENTQKEPQDLDDWIFFEEDYRPSER